MIIVMMSIGVQSYSNAYFGEGAQPILLNNVECSSSEPQLIDCSYDSNTTDCSHSEDAGVMCQLCKLIENIFFLSIRTHNHVGIAH